jgi:hemerythrin-like metal-binding protein
MPLFRWSAKYSIGIDLFDQQHLNLLNIINICQNYLTEGVGNDKVMEVLVEMARYADYHFDAEEKLMDIMLYPKSTKHHQAHQVFIGTIQKARQDIEKNQLDAFRILLKLSNFLQVWLIEHIQGIDKQMGNFYQNLTSIQINSIIQKFERNQNLEIWDELDQHQI